MLLLKNEQVGEFIESEVPGLVMPQGYKDSIASWYAVLREPGDAGVTRADLLRAGGVTQSHGAIWSRLWDLLAGAWYAGRAILAVAGSLRLGAAGQFTP